MNGLDRRFTADEIASTLFERAILIRDNLTGMDALADLFANHANRTVFNRPSLKVAERALRSQGMRHEDCAALDLFLYQFLEPELDCILSGTPHVHADRRWSASYHLGVRTRISSPGGTLNMRSGSCILESPTLHETLRSKFTAELGKQMAIKPRLFYKQDCHKGRRFGVPLRTSP